MHYVIGIDVSKATSQVAVAVDGKVTGSVAKFSKKSIFV